MVEQQLDVKTLVDSKECDQMLEQKVANFFQK